MRRLLVVVLGILMVAPAMAHAGGGPVPPIQGGVGASSPGAPHFGYVAVPAGPNTVVQTIWRDTGEVQRTRMLRGRWGVPGVSYDGATTGLSADGRTLVLAAVDSTRPTKLLVLDARTLKLRSRATIKGYSVVDAISPNGDWVYLIRYRSVGNNDYEVRAYDLANHRMAPKPIVDPHEPDEEMQGLPFSRAMSADGRWAYTLYGRPDGEPFVHALDTQGRTARCIDLEGFTFDDVADQKLTLSGGTLHVGHVALVDTKTFAVTQPKADIAPATHAAEPGGGGVPWLPIAAGILVLAAAGAAVRRLAGRRTAAIVDLGRVRSR
jgi:hypothetical protein